MEASTPGEQSDDASSVVEYHGNTSRAYRNQVLAIIGVCRFFSRFVVQGEEQDIEWRTVLKTCDDLLRFAAHSGHRANYKTNDRFESAIETLSTYAIGFHPGIDLVRARMGVAKRNDAVLYPVLPPPDLILVNFVVFRTLPDPKPVVVSLMLSQTAGIEEVLWNFTQFEDERRITLHDNPNFYSDLPTSFDTYTAQFKALPIKNFTPKPNTTIYVLVDQPRRVFLETKHDTRIFGNVFVLNDVMIFKDIHGVLEGESVVGESVWGIPNLWRDEKFFAIPDSTKPAYDFSLWPIITANPTAKRTTKDRKDLVCKALGSGDGDLRIYVGKLPPSWTIRKKFLPPPAPTTERPGYDTFYTTIHTLNVDILLKIFDFYRLDDEESWNLQLRWCKLTHVCQKWRHLIHESSVRLDIHIPFTNGTRPLHALSHLPPLPIFVDFRGWDAAGTDSGILHAIQQHDRIRRIDLKAPSSTLDKLIVPMNEPFPSLESLSLSSTTTPKEGSMLMIPKKFSAPNLRHLTSHGTCLPQGLPFLATSISLITLKLTDIQAPGYFTPDDLAKQLRHTPQLQELTIGFSIPLPRPHAEKELLHEPSTLTELPALKCLEFQGVGAYLEGLLARISTPRLERFNISLFPQLTFNLPRLTCATNTIEGLRRPVASVIFNQESVSFIIGSRQLGDVTFDLKVGFKHFDWQLTTATQVCRELEPILSVAEDLTLQFDDLPPDWRNVADDTGWRELLGPFNNAKRLRICGPVAPEIYNTLDSYRAGLPPGLLPVLQYLNAPLETVPPDISSTAIDSPPPSSHALDLTDTHIEDAQLTEPFEMIETDIPLLPDPPPPQKKSWFGKAVVDRVWKRLGPRVRAGILPVIRFVS